jgi:acetyl esterase/lipase
MGGALVVAVLVSAITPWPSAMLIRWVFGKGAAENVAQMQRHQPDSPVVSDTDLAYPDDAERPAFDVFTPDDGSTEPLPTVIWVHGGAWISGSKADVAPYLRILASEGYTTVGIGYTVAPEATYGQALEELNDGIASLLENAGQHRIDPQRVVLAGDSAGAQLASQLAVLTSNPDYAHLLGMTPSLDRSQLVGLVLNCGVYDLPAMAELSGVVSWGFKTALWAYTGTRDWSSTYAGSTMSTIDFVTEDLPPTFITGGNGDGLTWIQSVPMRTRMVEQGVDVTALFWPAGHEPALPHEYQFELDREEAKTALEQTLVFLARMTQRE